MNIARRQAGKMENTMAKLIVKKSITINAPPMKVWSILTSPDSIKRWMRVVPDFESGSPLQLESRVRWKDANGKPYLTGTVVALDPLRKLVLTLDDISWTQEAGQGDVTYALTLSEDESGTHLQWVFGDLAIDPEGQQWFDAYSASRELDMIKDMAEGQP
jgi:uncharacterized protein YndB with AHSA1/START domain